MKVGESEKLFFCNDYSLMIRSSSNALSLLTKARTAFVKAKYFRKELGKILLGESTQYAFDHIWRYAERIYSTRLDKIWR